MALRDNLKALREKQGLNGKEFAQRLGLKYSTYMTYETTNPVKSRWPNEETLVRIAAALHVSVDELLGYTVPVVGEYETYKDWLESYGYDVKEEGQAVKVFYHDPDSDLQDFNDLDSPAGFETRADFCGAVRDSLKVVNARMEKDNEQEKIRAVYDMLLCKYMFSE